MSKRALQIGFVVTAALLAATLFPFAIAADRKVTIYMSADTGDQWPAACAGRADALVLYAQRKHQIQWIIRNHPSSPCEGLDMSAVELRFETAVVGDDGTAAPPGFKKSLRSGLAWIFGLRATVSENQGEASDGLHSYIIYYANQAASGDPELEIDGDCVSGCGPGPL